VQEELIDKRQILELSKLPITLPKLIENINVNLIKQKYNFQSNIIIKNYTLNINSRTFFNEKKELRLTQREIDIILFLNQTNKSKNIITLQNEVWKHESKLDTHTVETHIYRLRKKIKEVFDDDNFIKSRNDGYSIQ
jgi:DNA-binding response OmpR family regulator